MYCMNLVNFIGTVFTAALLISASCKKEQNTSNGLPPATQSGANTLGAKFNSSVWTAHSCTTCFGGGTGIRASRSGNSFGIDGQSLNVNGGLTTLRLSLHNVKSVGDYTLTAQDISVGGVNFGQIQIGQASNSPELSYQTNGSYQGKVSITKLDLTHKIISGTFQGDLVNTSNGADIIHMTEGRFDVLYQE